MTLGMPVGTNHFVHILGIRFDRTTKQAAVEQILFWIAEKSRRMVITAGPEFVMKASADAQVRKLAHAADMVTPDGIGIIWAAKRRGIWPLERVTGVELVEHLLTIAEQRGQALRVYVLGAAEASHRRCLNTLRAAFPASTFAGRNGYFKAAEIGAIQSEIEAFEPDLWLVGLGQPRQEQMIYQSLAALPPCVGIGVGGSLDVWGGTLKRAPRVVQKLNLEWLYRLLRQPSRWRRQLALPRFAWKVLRNADRRS